VSRPPVRVTYVIPSLEIGGAERQLVKLANNLDRRCFQPAIVCVGAHPAVLDEVAGDVRVRCLRMGEIGGHARLRRLARGVLLAPAVFFDLALHRPEVVHAYLPAAYVVAGLAARVLRIRAVVAGRRSLLGIEAYRHGVWRRLAGLANRTIDLHVCNSEAARQMTMSTEWVPAARTAVVHNGIQLPDLSLQLPSPPATWGLGRRQLCGVSLANLIWHKDHEVLLRATAEVVRSCPGFRLVLIGDGPERGRIERLVGELRLGPNVVLAGRVPLASRFLRSFHFSALASVQESFPNAVVESMAAGVPVVATRVGGIPELVREGVDGLLVPAREPRQLAAAMLTLLREPGLADRLGRSARERIGETFTVEKMTRKTENHYLRLLDPASASS
jgi:glycosyltransferase involved in cell wall biosynthesis